MPPIRNVAPIKPMKTERTHEENQERAYIAASRRSDRSLEARIESARRASEIHKKRTGRGLRVTEQDVINEEMYEEEDEDMPSQYQRLSAHLHTNSMLFNRKLQDYIATQAAVRQSFYAQYQNQPLGLGHSQSFASSSSGGHISQGVNPFMHQQMPPPQSFNQNQNFPQSPSSTYTQQMYRTAPYAIPPRQNVHQRSASLSITQMPGYQQNTQLSDGGVNTPGEEQRRLSLPPQILEQGTFAFNEAQSRPALSRSGTSQTVTPQKEDSQNLSPQLTHSATTTSPPSVQTTPSLPASGLSGDTTPTNNSNVQLSQSSLFSMSLPPESQQLVAPALDPKDPASAMLMAGSEHIPMPMGTYHYNPNLSPKASRVSATVAPGMTISSGAVTPTQEKHHQLTEMFPFNDGPSMSEDMMYSSMMSSMPSGASFEFGGQDDLFQSMGLPQEDYDPNMFLNFDQS